MSDPPEKNHWVVPEVVREDTKIMRIGPWKVPQRTVINIALLVPLLGAAGYFFQNFLALRGVVDLAASRIHLVLLWLCLLGMAWILTSFIIAHRRLWFLATLVLVSGAVYGLDVWAPKPKIVSENKPQESKPEPQIVPVQPQPLPSKEEPKLQITKQRTPVVLAQRPYDLTGERRQKFMKLLSNPKAEPRDPLRIGCVAWSDASCVAAGKFLVLLSEAGWTIDSRRVFRLEPDVPIEGVAIVNHIDAGEQLEIKKLPPHLGHWQAMDSSHLVLWNSFTQMGIPVSGSFDTSLPVGTLGIYFGPEPTVK